MRVILFALMLLAGTMALAQYSGDGRIMSRTSDGFVYFLVTFPDSLDFTAADRMAPGGIAPNAAAYEETLQVARDFNFDGSVDDVGESFEYAPMQILVPSYLGTGPDTLWAKALDDTMGVIGLNYWIATSSLTATLRTFDPWLIRAERVAYVIGRQVKPSQGEFWKLESYHER